MAEAVIGSPFADFSCFGLEVDYARIHDVGCREYGSDG